MLLAHIFPHDEEDPRADQTELDGASEEERAAILQNPLHNLAATSAQN